ncbi:MAG: dihydrofolate reductase family protein [Gemmatimonadaceae bacterium]|nr:dihydrofolate reductase family protein [Gloeobacterales cyanobacterium ES-bin-141]
MTAISTTLVVAMTVDGKISAVDPQAPRDSDSADQAHLEYQVSLVDLILVGAGTIRAEGKTYLISNPELLAQRAVRGQPSQPVTCVVSHSLDLPLDLPFFNQDVRRWVLTTRTSLSSIHASLYQKAELVALGEEALDWELAYAFMAERGIHKVAALGGGGLNAELLNAGRIDDLWVTVWPVIYGGKRAPSPVEGEGFDPRMAPHLQLVETRQVGSELFLHYQVLSGSS